MREQKAKAEVKKKRTNYETIPNLCPPPTSWYESTTPPPNLCHPPLPPIIHNNNTMDTEFLVQIR